MEMRYMERYRLFERSNRSAVSGAGYSGDILEVVGKDARKKTL